MVNPLAKLALGCAAALAAACVTEPAPEKPGGGGNLGPPVERNGTVYTPMMVGPKGCILYNIAIPGGQAPTAMAYQDSKGRFSLGRPDPCIRPARRDRSLP